ncbi:unnamed protein product [Peniophora sp. CBMAI 1063]|nr:unnamed protein product [Peniophora sp. CBMAI 1063]
MIIVRLKTRNEPFVPYKVGATWYGYSTNEQLSVVGLGVLAHSLRASSTRILTLKPFMGSVKPLLEVVIPPVSLLLANSSHLHPRSIFYVHPAPHTLSYAVDCTPSCCFMRSGALLQRTSPISLQCRVTGKGGIRTNVQSWHRIFGACLSICHLGNKLLAALHERKPQTLTDKFTATKSVTIML